MVTVAIIYRPVMGIAIMDSLIEYSNGKNSYRKRKHGSHGQGRGQAVGVAVGVRVRVGLGLGQG